MASSRRRSLDAVMLFTGFIAATYGFGFYLFPAMVEAIRTDLPFSYAAMGAMSGGVQAGFMVSALLAGVLSLRFEAIHLVLGSVAACALALIGLAVVPNLAAMSLLLVVLGGCAAIVWIPMVDVVKAIVPPAHQAKALGLISSGTSYGVFVNSLLLANAIGPAGWRGLWLITGAIVTILALVGFLRLRTIRTMRHAADPVQGSAPILARLRTLPPRLSGSILVIMMLTGLCCTPYQTYLSAYLLGEAGLPAAAGVQTWQVMGLVGMGSGFAMGALADRITVRRGIGVTFLILALACALLIAAAHGGQQGLLLGAAIAFGLSFYPIYGLVPAYVGQVFGTGEAALLFAVGNIAQGFGSILGNALGGFLKQETGSFLPIYLVMLAAASLAALLSFLLPRPGTSGAAHVMPLVAPGA